MRKLAQVSLGLMLLVALAVPAAFAQQNGGPLSPQRQAQFQQRLQQDLGLNPDQAAQVQSIFQQEHAQMQQLGPSATQDQRMAIHQLTSAALQKVLTPEQFQKLQTMRKHHHHHHHQEQPDQPQQ